MTYFLVGSEIYLGAQIGTSIAELIQSVASLSNSTIDHKFLSLACKASLFAKKLL